MSETTLHTTLIKRTKICIIKDFCEMKNIRPIRIINNNHNELQSYEKQFNRKLTRMDAVIISPLTQDEINKLVNGYFDNTELQQWEKKTYEKDVKCHEENFGKPL